MVDHLLAAFGCFVALAVAGCGFVIETDQNVVGFALIGLAFVTAVSLILAGILQAGRPSEPSGPPVVYP